MPENIIFRSKVEPEIAEVPREIPEDTGTPLSPNTNGLKDVSDEKEIEKLAIWEGEKGKRYINEYFNTHNVSHEFTVKMPTSEIDKYVKAEMEVRGMEKTTKNYRDVLNEIEREIGSEKLQLFKRFSKLTGYIRAMNKLKAAKALRQKYIESTNPPAFS